MTERALAASRVPATTAGNHPPFFFAERIRMRRTVLLSLALLGLAAAQANADGGSITGYMFGDYYYVVSADANEPDYPEQQNAVQFRRIYCTYDRGLSDALSMRFRLEANDPGFGSTSKLVPYVKHAYLRWRGAVGSGDLYLGLIGTPTFEVAEKVWGYRSIEKTIMDLNRIGSSADMGAVIQGRAGAVAYTLMAGNGPGQSPETDNGKKLYASVDYVGIEGVHLEGYGDVNMRPGGRDQLTAKAFCGLQREPYRAGLEAFVRVNKKQAGNDDQQLTGLSAFGAARLRPGWTGFARADAVHDDSDDTTDMLVIAGVDRAVTEQVHLMPNLYVAVPDGPDPNVQARLTLFFEF